MVKKQTVILPEGMSKWVTINEAAKRLNLKTGSYVRTLIKKGKLVAKKLQIGHRQVWYVEPTSIEEYAANKGTFGAQSDYTRLVLRIKTTEVSIDEVRMMLMSTFGNEDEDWTLELAYQKKEKKAEPTVAIATIIEELTLEDLTEVEGDE